MIDLGFLGSVDLGDTLRLFLPCRNPSDVPTSPTGSPAFSIYGPSSDTALLTGSLGASDADSKTGYRTGDAEITSGNGFASGMPCRVFFTFVISSVTYDATATFQVT